jgi:hypothetical protein
MHMNKPFGTQGDIDNFPFKDLQETFYDQDGIEIEVQDGIMFIGVDDENKLDTAKELACLYLSIWTERQNIKVGADFNHKWRANSQGGKDHFLELHDTAKVTDRVQIRTVTHQVTIKGSARIVTQEMHDNASFTNDSAMLKKALKYPALKSALFHFSQEIVDDERPLYGVYKALDAIIAHLDIKEKKGRKKLADLAGQSFSYVDDVMQTTQTKRHNKTNATRKLDDIECNQRAKTLIDAFSNSLI